MPAGYSPASLARKLGVKDGQRTWRSGMPASVADEIARDGIIPAILASPEKGLEMAHVFATQRGELERELRQLRSLVTASGVVWVSWPKKASKRKTDITEDAIRAVALPLGFVDVKVCAVDDVWSGLKLMIRKSERS